MQPCSHPVSQSACREVSFAVDERKRMKRTGWLPKRKTWGLGAGGSEGGGGTGKLDCFWKGIRVTLRERSCTFDFLLSSSNYVGHLIFLISIPLWTPSTISESFIIFIGASVKHPNQLHTLGKSIHSRHNQSICWIIIGHTCYNVPEDGAKCSVSVRAFLIYY